MITGISKGLGKVLAESVIKEGDFVIGTFRNQSQVEEFNIQQKGKAFAIYLDLSNDNSITACVSWITTHFGGIDVLVNNTGIGFVGAIEETSTDEVITVFEANFFGPLKLTQAVLPCMRKQKSGNIILVSSHGGIKAFAGFDIYNASKFALEGFSEALAQEVTPLGIKVTLVEPGPLRSNFAGKSFREAENFIEDYGETAGIFRTKLKSVDGKQEGNPKKVAEAIIRLVYSKQSTLRMPLEKLL
ncbi:SDR family NAD(P)-dependent oxidoreductase [Maribacter litoralis]|uniref:SDR family NAD(P)-dependent oxidoreductase n=1 Tax=Maribacter litoralis TaxID=2059726 RepID=UPI003F5CEDEE